MSHCCQGNCAECSGCSNVLELSQQEINMLITLGQIPFLPVARKADNFVPVYLEETDYSQEEYSIILQLLEKKNLISLDYDQPLKGANMAIYKDFPVHGSMALTARGQQVLEMLNIDGIQ